MSIQKSHKGRCNSPQVNIAPPPPPEIISWPKIGKQNAKKNFVREHATRDHAAPIKIHKITEEFKYSLTTTHEDLN
jgi:hypothetical protein